LSGTPLAVFAAAGKSFGKNSANQPVVDDDVIEFGAFRLNAAERSLMTADDIPIQLTRRLYETLRYMLERPGRLLEKQAIMDVVWKGAVVEENTLSRTVSTLRKILGERDGESLYIETVSGIGYRFVAAVTATRRMTAEPQLHAREPSLAVLPFEDLSPQHDQGYFADGIAEEVLSRLTSVSGLRLIARSSSFRFRDGAQSAQAIGHALGADYLLTGAVRNDGARLRITAQLIESSTDSQRWCERFDEELALAHIFAIQEKIAHTVARALSLRFGIGEALAERGTLDFEAYDLYLRGKALIAQASGPAIVRAAELLHGAVKCDPGFAEAWLWLSHAGRARLLFAPEHSAAALRDIHEATAKTVELAPHWWAARMSESWKHHLKRDWLAMERSLASACELAPELPSDLQFNLGIFHANVADSPRAIESFRAATRSDPLSLLASGLLQKELVIAGRHDEAEREYHRSLDLPGDREMGEHLSLHRLWARGEAFSAQLRRYLDLTQTRPLPVLEEVYAVRGKPPLALEKLRTAAAAVEYQNPRSQLMLAWWIAAYGDPAAAFDAMWRGYVDMSYVNASWLWLPVLKRARAQPRFRDLLANVGLIDYWRAKGRTIPEFR
jgi:TolB-like protein